MWGCFFRACPHILQGNHGRIALQGKHRGIAPTESWLFEEMIECVFFVCYNATRKIIVKIMENSTLDLILGSVAILITVAGLWMLFKGIGGMGDKF